MILLGTLLQCFWITFSMILSRNFYQRYGKIYLHDKPALFNVTHVKTKRIKSILNNGQVTVVFPVATWHEGILVYVYEVSIK